MKKATTRKGDTLIEVTLAVGIFSMVAVAVLAVMNGSASSAQTALEATLTREEIDAQADALRFIHSAYVADKSIAQSDSGETKSVTQIMADSDYAKLWHEIISNPANADSLAAYPPSTCETAYSDTSLANAFILNTHLLGEINNGTTDNIVIRPTDGSDLFATASTYPRLVYADSASLLANSNTFQSAEGLYIIPVSEQVPAGATPSYYDFYIRSCWYGIGDRDTAPSTISTVMRLYNPDYVKPTKIASCTNDADYVMVDTNMFIGDGGHEYEYRHSGVQDIYLEFDHASITTGDHYKCLNQLSPGLTSPGGGVLQFDDQFDEGRSRGTCLSGYNRLKVQEGDKGDFWYPVHVDDAISITLYSQKYILNLNDVNTDHNPFICDEKGVTCKFCTVESSSTACDTSNGRIVYDDKVPQSYIEEIIKSAKPNKLEVIIGSVNSCMGNTEDFNGNRSISINTYWKAP